MDPKTISYEQQQYGHSKPESLKKAVTEGNKLDKTPPIALDTLEAKRTMADTAAQIQKAYKQAQDDSGSFEPFGINLPTVGRYAGVGVAGGLTAAAIVELIRRLKEDKEKRDEKEDEIRGNEIVLTLPKTGAADKKDKDSIDGVKHHETKKVVTTTADRGRMRNTDGKYLGVKTANWQTLLAAMLAVPALGYSTYKGVTGALASKRTTDLEDELEQAKQEYLDKLVQAHKTAADHKDPTFDVLDYGMAIPILAAILGTGGTAWMTKRILENYDRKQPKIKTRPKIKKILFKTESPTQLQAPPEDEEDEDKDKEKEELVSIEPGADETIKAATCVYMDICSKSTDIMTHPDVVTELEKIGSTPAECYKLASDNEDYKILLGYLEHNPQLRDAVKRIGMDQHPILKYFKWGVGIPGIRELTDIPFYKKLKTMLHAPQINPENPLNKKVAADDEMTQSKALSEYDKTLKETSKVPKEYKPKAVVKQPEEGDKTVVVANAKQAGTVPGVPDGTGPHGRGAGPGAGRGDGTGLKRLMAILEHKEEDKEEKGKKDQTEQDPDEEHKEASIATSLIGSTIADGLLKHPDESEDQEEEDIHDAVNNNNDAVVVEALDPEAKAVLLRNKEKVQKAIEIALRDKVQIV